MTSMPGIRTLIAIFSLFPASLLGQEGFFFEGPMIVRLDHGVQSLKAADLNGDGRTDLVLVNNARARLEVLLQRSSQDPPKSAQELERNVPPDDPRFEKSSVLTERAVGGLAVGDFDGDGKADLAWYGDRAALVVAFQREGGTFTQRKEFRILNGSQSSEALLGGDFNADGLRDLALLCDDELAILWNSKTGLKDPERQPLGLRKATVLRTRDLDRDGRTDLLVLEPSDAIPLRVRYQRTSGDFGPELSFKLPALKSLFVPDSADDEGLLVVSRASGTLRRVRFVKEDKRSDSLALGAPRIHPFKSASEDRSAFGEGDIDGDGRTDVLVLDAGGAQVHLWRQLEGGDLVGPTSFPTLKGVIALRVGDLDGDGKAEVAVASKDEKSVGIHTWDGKRLLFPRTVPAPGTPVGIEVADLNGDGKADLAVCSKEKKEVTLTLSLSTGETKTTTLEGMGDVTALRGAEIDGDPAFELLAFSPYDPPIVFDITAEGAATRRDSKVVWKETTVANVAEAAFTFADLDGDSRAELVFPQEAFARAARLGDDGALRLVDQINAPAGAKIIAAAFLDADGAPGAEAVLLDEASSLLRVFVRNETGTYREAQTIDLPGENHRALRVAEVTGDGKPDLLVFGGRSFLVLAVGSLGFRVLEDPPYESKVEGSSLGGIRMGELGGPSGKEIVVLDQGRSALEILVKDEQAFRRAAGWRVFETKAFDDEGRSNDLRECLLADVTADQKTDICLLVHDRLVIYPQK